MSKLRCAVLVIAALAGAAGAEAQTYPSRPISMVVPYSAGGPTDTIARIVAERMRAPLGQMVIVENVTGAAGTIGVGKVARAAPDGYTISIGHWGTHVVNGAIYTLAYDVLTDFEPVAMIATNPQIIVAKKAVPARDLQGLIAWLKANSATATQGTAGYGSGSHLSGIYFQNITGARFQFVPYRGAGPAMQDLVAGQVDLMIDQAANSLPQVRAGTIKAYAVTDKVRLAAAPDIPTVDEAGVPGLHIAIWHGIWTPKGTPKAINDKLNAALVETLADPGVRERLAQLGQEIPAREQQTPQALFATAPRSRSGGRSSRRRTSRGNELAADQSSRPREAGLELGVKRIGAGEDVAEVCDHDRLGAAFPQQRRELMHVLGRAVQRDHARRGRPAERRLHAEATLGLGEQRFVAAGKAGAHLAKRARPRLRRDAVEHPARDRALGRPPAGGARRDQIRLRAQDHAIVDHLERVGGKRRARGGDVDDELGSAGRGRRLGGARALHDPIVGDAVPGKEVARKIHVFGRHAHLALVLETERDGHIVEIGHAVHVDPRLRHGDRYIGVAEAEAFDEHHAPLRVGYFLAHQILAGDAEMHRALRQEIDNLSRREIRHLDAGEVCEGAAVVARTARLDELEPGARKESFRVRL